jgi:hypothetical protein
MARHIEGVDGRYWETLFREQTRERKGEFDL